MSLLIDIDWIDQPAARDPLERRTWADLRILCDGRCLTRVWDRQSLSERKSIFIPIWPLAIWIVRNWWPLQYEACRTEHVPSADLVPTLSQWDWLHRHCLRTADSGLLLPALYIFSGGDDVCLKWMSDSPGSYPHMPCEFIDSGDARMSQAELSDTLSTVMRTVVDRVSDLSDPRVVSFLDDWAAIKNNENDEAVFCQAAGRLGLDPYETDSWDPSILELIETALGSEISRPLGQDFLDSVDDFSTGASAWAWLAEARIKFTLEAAPPKPLADRALEILGTVATGAQNSLQQDKTPAQIGYRRASVVRAAMNQATGAAIEIADACDAIHLPLLRYEDHNHLPTRSIKAIVGWQDGKQPAIVGPKPARPDNRRFLEARALYLAAFQAYSGPRLCTSAYTSSQQASRAFAAELLAPRYEVMEHWNSSLEDPEDRIQSLAHRYGVSTEVIRRQLQNSGIDLLAEQS